MRLSRDELIKEVESVQKILSALRARRRILQEQAAQYGTIAPPQILIEIEDLIKRIEEVSEEVNSLEIQAVEEQLPLNETEYRLELARTWNTLGGYPSIEGFA